MTIEVLVSTYVSLLEDLYKRGLVSTSSIQSTIILNIVLLSALDVSLSYIVYPLSSVNPMMQSRLD